MPVKRMKKQSKKRGGDMSSTVFSFFTGKSEPQVESNAMPEKPNAVVPDSNAVVPDPNAVVPNPNALEQGKQEPTESPVVATEPPKSTWWTFSGGKSRRKRSANGSAKKRSAKGAKCSSKGSSKRCSKKNCKSRKHKH
jgi:hypothetical protein